MTTLAQSERHTAAGLASYATRRKWSRTDTARWLDDRCEAVMAQLRRRGRECPAHTKRIGHWLKEEARDLAFFGRAHARMADLPNDEARAEALVLEVLK